MRLDTFKPTGYPTDPLTNGPIPVFQTEMEGRHYDIFTEGDGVWVFGTSNRRDQGGGIGGVVGVKFSAAGAGTVGGEEAKKLLAKYTQAFPLPNKEEPEEGKPAKKSAA